MPDPAPTPKECAYCGGEPKVSKQEQFLRYQKILLNAQVVCQKCWMAGPTETTVDEAVLTWNEVTFRA